MAKKITKKVVAKKVENIEEVKVVDVKEVEAPKAIDTPKTKTTPPTLIEQLAVQRQISKNL